MFLFKSVVFVFLWDQIQAGRRKH